MSGLQSRRLEKEMTRVSLPGIEPQSLCRPSRSIVTLPTGLSRLLLLRNALHILLHVGTSSVMLGKYHDWQMHKTFCFVILKEQERLLDIP